MYVETHRWMGDCGESTNVQQTSSVVPGDGSWEDITVDDVLDTTCEKLCYIYE